MGFSGLRPKLAALQWVATFLVGLLFPPKLFSFNEPPAYGILVSVDGQNYQCDAEYSWTTEPPFMISDAFGNDGTMPESGETYEHNWDNFRSIEDSAGVTGFIPQRTIVRLINPDHSRFAEDQAETTNVRLPVEVISVPANGGREFVEQYRTQLRKIMQSDGQIVREGQVGRIDARSLQPAGRFTYLVSEPSFLSRLPGIDDTVAGQARAVELITRGSGDDIEYEARKCCLSGDPERCVYKHRWRILNEDLEETGDFELNPFSEEGKDCGIMDSIRPIDRNQARPILEILAAAQQENPNYGLDDIEFIDSMGLVRFPWQYYEDAGDVAIEGPYNSSHYNPDGGEAMYDSFVNATTGCAFTNVLREWNNRYPDRRDEVQVGNMWHPEHWGTHDTHEQFSGHGAQGTCIDIRPLSTGRSRSGLNTGSGNYSRERTREFIQLMRAAGADPVWFNDSRISESTFMRRHADHIHVCFNPNSETVQNACRNGL